MLRIGQQLLKYSYNGSPVNKYYPKTAPEVQKTPLKETFTPGDAPEYLYNSNIKFNPEYKPYTANGNHGFLIMTIVVFSYLTYRYERVRKLQGKTQTHQYPI